MANEKRLIDANDVYALFDKNGTARLHVADIDLIPTVDAVEVVHGHWRKTRKYDEDAPVQCSRCLMEFDYIDGMCYLVTGEELPFYCPNCGAKMDGDENG